MEENYNEHIFHAVNIKKYFKNQKSISDQKSVFTDPIFPPNNNSLFGLSRENMPLNPDLYDQESSKLNTQNIIWKRASDIFKGKNPKIFMDKIEFDDTRQGEIGNCYFISACSALTEYPNLIKNLFKIKEYNAAGYYEIALFIDGYWQIVILDDYFPINKITNNFCFANPNGNELWVALLEKAWAKVNGGYLNIIGGYAIEALSALTGFNKKRLKINNKDEHEIIKEKIENLWKIILDADEKGNIMCAGTKSDKSLESEKINLSMSHAYTVISAKEINYRNLLIRLLKIRNPWGKGEWKGDWSDESPLWNEALKSLFGFKNYSEALSSKSKNFNDDGTFFMSIDDFFKYFSNLDICNIIYNAYVKFVEVPKLNYSNEISKDDLDKKINFPYINIIEIPETCNISFSINNPYYRFNLERQESCINPTTLILAKLSENKQDLNYINGGFSVNDAEICKNLDKGFYIICTLKNPCLQNLNFQKETPLKNNDFDKSDNSSEDTFKHDYRVKIICDKTFKVLNLGFDRYYNVLRKIIYDGILNSDTAIKTLAENEYFIDGDNSYKNSGIGYFIVINKTSNMNLYLNLDYSKIENFNNLYPHQNINDEYSIYSRPNSVYLSLAMRKEEFGKYWYNVEIPDNKYQHQKFKEDKGKQYDRNIDIYEFFSEKKLDVNNLVREFSKIKINDNYYNYITLNNSNNADITKNLINIESDLLSSKNNLPNQSKSNFIKNGENNYGKIDAKELLKSIGGKILASKNFKKETNENKIKDPINLINKNDQAENKRVTNNKKFNLNNEQNNLNLKSQANKHLKCNQGNAINQNLENNLSKIECDNKQNFAKIKEEYPKIIQLLLHLEPMFNEEKLIWKKTILENGIYVGLHDSLNFRQGRGAYIYEDNSFIIANFSKGKREGKVYEFNNDYSISFEGYYIEGKRNGKGIIKYKNGNKYIGEFQYDMKDGNGTYYFDIIKKLEGTFCRDNIHGQAFYTTEKDEVVLVKFDNGVQVFD